MDRLDGIENVDMVIGGPPCQGFSVAGKMDVNDKKKPIDLELCKGHLKSQT